MGNKKAKVIVIMAGLSLFLLFPFLYNAVGTGLFQEVKIPKPKIEKPGKCVKETDFMRANHGKLLVHNRSDIVREGKRQITGLKTCRKCHTNREEFCDRCHNFVGVFTLNEKMGCLACHYYPKNKMEAMETTKNE